jgi:hypothetical protein
LAFGFWLLAFGFWLGAIKLLAFGMGRFPRLPIAFAIPKTEQSMN